MSNDLYGRPIIAFGSCVDMLSGMVCAIAAIATETQKINVTIRFNILDPVWLH